MDMELIGATEDRAATYGLLARLYNREIDEALLAELGRLPLGDAEDASPAGAGARLMRSYLDECGPDAITELAVDFARLFLVRTAKTKDAPYPFESVYTSEEGITMGDARDAVLADYRREGLDKSSSWTLAEDHIALELEFEQALCLRTADALRAENLEEARRLLGRQRAFLAQHLTSWTEPFFAAKERTAHTGLYRGLAGFTAGFLQEDERYLEALTA